MRALILSAIVAPLAFAALPALAQNPSAESIIQSLKPTGNLTSSTRGIKMANPSAAPAPAHVQAATTASTAPKPAPAAPAQTTASGPSVSLSVEFATDSAALTPQARKTLDQLGMALTSADLAQYHFRIEGHTDTVGSAGYNKALSQRRADAVAAYLEQKFGVQRVRLEAVGLGEEGLAVPTPPQTANAQNRRVKVVNLGG
jgi:OmpA-OmpF porin, OOP family